MSTTKTEIPEGAEFVITVRDQDGNEEQLGPFKTEAEAEAACNAHAAEHGLPKVTFGDLKPFTTDEALVEESERVRFMNDALIVARSFAEFDEESVARYNAEKRARLGKMAAKGEKIPEEALEDYDPHSWANSLCFLHGEDADGKTTGAAVALTDDIPYDKRNDYISWSIERISELNNLRYVALIVASWIAPHDDEEVERASQHSKAHEVVLVHAFDNDAGDRIGQYKAPILRDENNVPSLGEFERLGK